MNHLNIDIETYSSVDIKTSGAYKYAQSPDFEILLFAYSLNNSPVKIIDLAQGEKIPDEIVKLLNGSDCIKHAYNAAFEWWCLNQAGYKTDIAQWQCTMIQGLYCGYPAGLEQVGKALGLSQDKSKSTAGKNLIKYFSIPCKATKTNGGRLRNLPRHEPEKWQIFKDYCVQDVITEMEVLRRFEIFPVPDKEWDLWRFDILMNSEGVKIDKRMVENALYIDEKVSNDLQEEAKKLTGVLNPNSTAQLKPWLESQGLEIDNLQKETVSELVETVVGDVKRVLEIRQELSKTSTKKYVAMREGAGSDDRVRGLLQFYGANRTGRYAGRLVQVQNLPRNYLDTLDTARELVKNNDIEILELFYGNIPDTLSQLIRTAFIPEVGKKFVVADFSAIEARVIAWLAGEEWRQNVFRTHGKIYEASASQMFGVPIERIVKGNKEYELRQKGKIAELALGYGGSVGALKAMGADKMGLSDDELQDIVYRWRSSNKRIYDLWQQLGNAAAYVIENKESVNIKGLILAYEYDFITGLDFMTIQLPSKRKLYYASPGTRLNSWNATVITYKGVNQTTRKWETQESYGGKLVENVTQAIARDCLAESLIRVKNKGFKIVMHIHDEIVVETEESVTVDEICNIMGQNINWADGLLLNADGFESYYYKKD
ncbi:DNA polymerase [Sebaldella sp. S0638]|uniref:DNA polymerase n=1 Tax=Sebaldella sp. S0638 TaxID=2957809 RepID=UPI00209DFB8D|nr:DNA polymerase [Sebaldella sp. S0638]MCP1225699.1 DNA polymerase [Sebaldella sp. S0638]